VQLTEEQKKKLDEMLSQSGFGARKCIDALKLKNWNVQRAIEFLRKRPSGSNDSSRPPLFSSDQHFFHKNIIEYCKRPYESMHHMHEALIENWNQEVSPEDTIYVLGDFCFGGADKTRSIVHRLNGNKILVIGNHDHEERKMLSYGFNDVYQSMSLSRDGIEVQLSHYPYWPKPGELPDKEYRYQSRRPHDSGGWLLHGHVHEAWKVRDKMINVGVDQWNYRPVRWDQVVELIKTGPVRYKKEY
jgi:calcineurin-like phosphoesterase family protein